MYLNIEIKFWRSFSEQFALANAFQRFAAISGDHQALAGQLMLPKGASSLKILVKVWVASERESLAQIEESGQWVSM